MSNFLIVYLYSINQSNIDRAFGFEIRIYDLFFFEFSFVVIFVIIAFILNLFFLLFDLTLLVFFLSIFILFQNILIILIV